MSALLFAGGFTLYCILARLIVTQGTGAVREVIFALLNVAAYYLVYVFAQHTGFLIGFLFYFPAVVILYVVMRLFSQSQGPGFWIAFSAPILALILARYLPFSWGAAHFLHLLRRPAPPFLPLTIAPYLVGISYLAFRCSRLTLEVRNGLVEKPGFWSYVGFCFFLPTMSVGPINTYQNYRRGFGPDRPLMPIARCLLRILVGSVKYLYLGTLLSQLSFPELLLDDHYHRWIDLPIAAIFYYLFLYCNFSGFCDMAIGGAGLVGIPVPENFDSPFIARNVKDFWNRWHITLSVYMRDIVFSPVSKFLAHRMGMKNIDHAIALTILFVFLLVGVWHGVGWNYAAFGLFHGIGVAGNHYYTIALKNRLGRDGMRAYNASPGIRAIAIVLTFLYVSASMFFFANTPHQMTEIWTELK
jgi:D-alanyl-lipoteichoic acid acyltransferase DltB (MBOAT superfamily)